MNAKQYFGLFRQFSLAKLLNVVVILSMLLASCGTPEKAATVVPTETAAAEKEPEQNNYEPPVYTHPEPLMGERPTNQSVSADKPAPIQESSTQEAGQDAVPSVNGAKVSSTPTVSVIPQASPSPMSKIDPKQQINGMKQGTDSSAGAEAEGATVVSVGKEWFLNDAYKNRASEAIMLTDQYLESAQIAKASSAWDTQQIDLSQDFDRAFTLYFGTINGTYRGGDGITFVLQNEGTDAIGTAGGGLGYGGISPSVAVEFDTFRNSDFGDPGYSYNSFDSNHVALLKNGNMLHTSALPIIPYYKLEDGKEYTFRFQWTASTHQLNVFSLDTSEETLLISYTEDFTQTIFGGNSEVWLGFTGGSYYAVNKQYVYEHPLTTVDGINSSKENCNLGCSGGTTQNTPGGPINTRTGGYDYFVTDISIPSTAGEISFERTYTSLGVPLYSTNLGYGWDHNHDMYLSFGEYDSITNIRKVTLNSDTTNQYNFFQKTGSTTLEPYNGVLASLTQGEDYYILKDKAQNEYHFDLSSGRIISRTDSNGRELVYTYDTAGWTGSAMRVDHITWL